ncbi:hypothetical protein B0T14DRAFT_559970 [Immersiella caudata]|uniref:DNA/RNA-binding domain-containing protein n=1 Tax=Immersiella caudata TaxID=314043 RepID=A0AA40CCE5_9PEZI|nr:hypothetical protein B0T14DRAFT_559970 [Immersiella caudata]
MDEKSATKENKDIATSWSEYLRRQSKKHQPAGDGDPGKSPGITRESPVADVKNPPSSGQESAQKKPAGGDPPAGLTSQPDQESSARSPPSSLKREGSSSRSASPPKRPKGKPADESRADFDRGPLHGRGSGRGKLWNPDGDSAPPRPASYDRSNVAANHRIRLPSGTHQHSRPPRQNHHQAAARPSEESSTELIKQPETRPISQEQLVAEVKGIYAGLVMVENKCIEVDNAQNTQNDPNNTKLNNEQWQALIALHRTLLHEHHDFFLASQHPSASPALRRLASKYAMPARMWRHGIHSFLELLRHRLPASLEHMLTFIYLAYSMMALLYETVPAFKETWIECLGDLGRYRMAIEDDNPRDREVWTAVSRGWYSKASDSAPGTGRLYHHLAILARPNALQQLFYYNKSLCVAIPFVAARDSIMTLFDPIMAPNSSQQSRLPSTEHAFVKTHGIMFSKKDFSKLEPAKEEFINTLDNHAGRSGRRFLEPGSFIAVSNCCAVTGYGSDNNPIYSIIKQDLTGEQQDQPMSGNTVDEASLKDLAVPLDFSNKTHRVLFSRFGDPNILSYVHTVLAFLYHSTFYDEAMEVLAPEFPWKLLSLLLNTLLSSCQSYTRIESDDFPHPEKDDSPRPLPEDYAMRGLVWIANYYPKTWFDNDKIEDDEKGLEAASMGEERKVRVLYLGCRIARNKKWLRYDSNTHQFSVAPQFNIELEHTPVASAASIDFGELPDAIATP